MKTDGNYFVALTRWLFFTLDLSSPDRRPPRFPATACPPRQPAFCVAGPLLFKVASDISLTESAYVCWKHTLSKNWQRNARRQKQTKVYLSSLFAAL